MSIQPGIYQHYKGPKYRVYSLARHTETEELVVVYEALYETGLEAVHKLWVRPLDMFTETVEVDGETIPRFRLIEALDE